jgi:tetratricopeptide (TPR) repeat protein
MNTLLNIVAVALLTGAVLAAVVWGLIRFARKTEEDSGSFIVKGLLSLAVLGLLVYVVFFIVKGMEKGDRSAAFIGVPMLAACALVLAILWGRNVGGFFASSLTDIFDGGQTAPDPTPFYSIVRAKLKQGRTTEALEALNAQLEKFPDHFGGLMLLAEIQSEHHHDLEAATLTIERIANTPERPPGQIAGAFSTLADWRLKLAHDPAGARRAFEEITARLPDSEWSVQAAQRIAHLVHAADSTVLGSHERVALHAGEDRLGLLKPKAPPPETPVELLAEEEKLVGHLGEYPLDTEARERLALLYARELGQPQLGMQQLEYLIALPHQSPKHLARWLNLLADLQVEFAGDPETARATLQRIVDTFAGTAPAETARRRLDTLAYEFKGKQKSQAVKLGAYEQNLGLRKGWRPPTAT